MYPIRPDNVHHYQAYHVMRPQTQYPYPTNPFPRAEYFTNRFVQPMRPIYVPLTPPQVYDAENQ